MNYITSYNFESNHKRTCKAIKDRPQESTLITNNGLYLRRKEDVVIWNLFLLYTIVYAAIELKIMKLDFKLITVY